MPNGSSQCKDPSLLYYYGARLQHIDARKYCSVILHRYSEAKNFSHFAKMDVRNFVTSSLGKDLADLAKLGCTVKTQFARREIRTNNAEISAKNEGGRAVPRAPRQGTAIDTAADVRKKIVPPSLHPDQLSQVATISVADSYMKSDSISHIHRAVEMYDEAGQYVKLAIALIKLIELYLYADSQTGQRSDETRVLYIRLSSIIDLIDEPAQKTAVYAALAKLDVILSQEGAAINHYQRALRYCDFGKCSSLQKGIYFLGLGRLLKKSAETSKAQEMLQKALELISPDLDCELRAEILILLASFHDRDHSVDGDGAKMLEEARRCYEKAGLKDIADDLCERERERIGTCY